MKKIFAYLTMATALAIAGWAATSQLEDPAPDCGVFICDDKGGVR